MLQPWPYSSSEHTAQFQVSRLWPKALPLTPTPLCRTNIYNVSRLSRSPFLWIISLTPHLCPGRLGYHTYNALLYIFCSSPSGKLKLLWEWEDCVRVIFYIPRKNYCWTNRWMEMPNVCIISVYHFSTDRWEKALCRVTWTNLRRESEFKSSSSGGR